MGIFRTCFELQPDGSLSGVLDLDMLHLHVTCCVNAVPKAHLHVVTECYGHSSTRGYCQQAH